MKALIPDLRSTSEAECLFDVLGTMSVSTYNGTFVEDFLDSPLGHDGLSTMHWAVGFIDA